MASATPTTPPTRRAGPPTRERILTAALELFASQGYEATSTAQIEAAAGLSPRSGALYKHFHSKEQLLEVALAQRMQEITTLPDRLDFGSLSDLRSELTLIARWGLAELARERELALIVMKDGHRLPQIKQAFLDSIVRPGHALAVEVLRRYSASHDVEFDDVEALGEVLCSALVGFALQGFLFGKGFVDIDDDRFASAHVEVAMALVVQNERRKL
ncbi:MAG: TetR/AcrR family transcriptional regulator [Actinomycetota bacterium]|nr:TetR/AcrR family transcriptional regulator [Actinomycetota bacterium]